MTITLGLRSSTPDAAPGARAADAITTMIDPKCLIMSALPRRSARREKGAPSTSWPNRPSGRRAPRSSPGASMPDRYVRSDRRPGRTVPTACPGRPRASTLAMSVWLRLRLREPVFQLASELPHLVGRQGVDAAQQVDEIGMRHAPDPAA